MVQGSRGYANFQRVYACNRYVERGLRTGRDAEREAVVSGQGLQVFYLTSVRAPPLILHPPDHHQLSLILDMLGTPSIDDFYAISSSRSREYIRALPFRKRVPFAKLYPKASALAVDLLEKLLTFSPKRRIEVSHYLWISF